MYWRRLGHRIAKEHAHARADPPLKVMLERSFATTVDRTLKDAVRKLKKNKHGFQHMKKGSRGA
jgi:trimethylamine:corrinoid methyltransferase-like protein